MPNSMTQKIVKNPVLAMQVKQGREVRSRDFRVYYHYLALGGWGGGVGGGGGLFEIEILRLRKGEDPK